MHKESDASEKLCFLWLPNRVLCISFTAMDLSRVVAFWNNAITLELSHTNWNQKNKWEKCKAIGLNGFDLLWILHTLIPGKFFGAVEIYLLNSTANLAQFHPNYACIVCAI